ncbi:DUF4156 domain-containing protein [Aliiglaciecola lipolytica]|uniref:DUF4156 domain-containing protein n=1 Tax=Aliiglaciecola lipolytica E3 TaxID=1127673 RepID=K6XZ01_9ALTE|nr:DUF4156 domain-containing protein [Aliiglaciecola lipolytica]GAC16861.1 hypothetical protein GLIP_4250 [Aliiglaciecola lipolytica E3]
MNMLTRYFTLTFLLAVTSACSLGKFQAENQAVKLQNPSDVADCTLLGTVTEKSRDRWASARTDKKIATEVLDLARSEAAKLGGNTLVEKTALIMGSQTFTVYSCT